MKFHYLNRIIHRDFGYFFFGMTIIYALSGIALNHIKDWNPNYIIQNESYNFEFIKNKSEITKNDVDKALTQIDELDNYKKHYSPKPYIVKIFIDGGSLEINTETGDAYLEKISRRPIFYHVNLLHYNPGRGWIYFSDFFAVSLILIAITGLFILKGKNGIKGRGAWLTAIGIIIPILFLIFL